MLLLVSRADLHYRTTVTRHFFDTASFCFNAFKLTTASNKADGCGTKVKNERIRVAFEGHSHGGTLVIADTKAQVMKACRGNMIQD